MALYDMPRARVGGAPAGFGLGALMTLISDWRSARQTRKALMALSDEELDDIGLARSDIERIVRL